MYWITFFGVALAGGWSSFANPGNTTPVYVRDAISPTQWRATGVGRATAYEVTVRDAMPGTPTVVPEPGAYLLMVTGLVGLALVARRRTAGGRGALPSAGDHDALI